MPFESKSRAQKSNLRTALYFLIILMSVFSIKLINNYFSMQFPDDNSCAVNSDTILYPIEPLHDYSSLLDQYGVKYIENQYYWQVGSINKTQGWILHLSVIYTQLQELLKLIVPELIKDNISFKVVRDVSTAKNLVDGSLGYINLGKLISIYPENDLEAMELAKRLINLTFRFHGPAVPTDFHLGGVLYTRYGSFKPILYKNEKGDEIKHIYNTKGKLIPDAYSVPFSMPSALKWPFQSIASLSSQHSKKLLNKKYYPLLVLKPDAKGNVIKALHFENLLKIRPCLIKQGHKYMAVDKLGRDIRDKLKWQLELYNRLSDSILLPRVFGYFEENGDGYLAMEFINGVSLQTWIQSIYKGHAWSELSAARKLAILNCILDVVRKIKRLHELGYIHRDITPENFLINTKGEIFLLDMELAWSMNEEKPDPPFRLGTFGFMSPEQSLSERPTVKQDIYSLGAFLLVFFTNLTPNKWKNQNTETLKGNLSSFLGCTLISHLISYCLQKDPSKRPEISNIESDLEQVKIEVQNTSILNKIQNMHGNLSPDTLKSVTQAGINGLANPNLLSPKDLWLSRIQKKDNHVGNEQAEMALYKGWHVGISGPLWLVAKATKAGFDISACKHCYSSSWSYLEKNYFSIRHEIIPGLFSGSAGIALALAEALNSGLILPDKDSMSKISYCFSQKTSRLNLSNGIAGQGIALLHCSPWMEPSKVQELIASYISEIISTQNKAGFWQTYLENENKRNNPLDISTGVAGILLFLLAYLQHCNRSVETLAQKALRWLIKKAFTKEGYYKPEISSQEKLGITLCLIRAYSIFENPKYKELAESNLQAFPLRPVISDFSLDSGLSGLGEVYLEAFVIFNNTKWMERATSIAELFVQTFNQSNQDAGYWITNESDFVTADLFVGYSGILHFLIRYLSPNTFTHPLWPGP